MIIPVTHNLDPIIIGTTYDPEALTIYIDDEIKVLTDCIVELVIDGVVTLTDGSGLVIDAVNGMIAPLLTATQTLTNYTVGHLSYCLNITEPDGITKYRYAEGIIEVRA